MRRDLIACEEAWELAFTRCNQLALSVVAARTAHNFSRTAGHQILAAIAKAHSAAGDGQSEMATAHRMMERFALANDIMLSADDFGDGRKPPVTSPFTGA